MLKKSVGVTISVVTVERYGVVSGAYRDQVNRLSAATDAWQDFKTRRRGVRLNAGWGVTFAHL